MTSSTCNGLYICTSLTDTTVLQAQTSGQGARLGWHQQKRTHRDMYIRGDHGSVCIHRHIGQNTCTFR